MKKSVQQEAVTPPVEQPVEPVVKEEQPVEPVVKEEKVELPQEKEKEQWTLLDLLKSPWLLVFIPLLCGGIWLVNNLWVITNNLDKPYLLLSGPALGGSIVAVWFLINFFKGIVSTLRATWTAFNSWRNRPGSIFWMVIIVFLIVSVLESGTFFNELLGPNALFGVLGYASALVIDLVSVECMRARQRAVRRRDKQGESLFQLGVIVCALISAFGNGYIALEHFVDPQHTQIPVWMIHVAPLVGVIFPLLMVFLSFAGDYTAAQDSSSLDPEEFKKSENDRIRFIEIQKDVLQRKLNLESDMIRMAAKAGKVARTFFLIRWFCPQDALSMPLVVENVFEKMQEFYTPLLQGQIEYNQMLENKIAQVITYTQQSYSDIQVQLSTLRGERDADLSLISQRFAEAQKQFECLVNGSKDETITLLQTRFTTTINALQNAPRSATQTPPYGQGQMHFNNGDTQRLGRTQNGFQNDRNMQEDVTRTTTQRGYQIENDPEAISLLSAYPNLQRWMDRSQKSATLEEIATTTLHSRKMINNRITDGTIKRTRNKNTFIVETIIKWLLTAPLPRSQTVMLDDNKDASKVHDMTQENDTLSDMVHDILDAPQTDGSEDDTTTDVTHDTDEFATILDDVEDAISAPQSGDLIAS